MKRKYHILSIIISAALLAGCLSACGESGTIGGSSSDENTAATVTGGDAATTPVPPPSPFPGSRRPLPAPARK